jgi:hypothetical protein
MLYLSHWDSDSDANDFAKIYAEYVPKRYTKALKLSPAEEADKFCPGSGCDSGYFFQTEEGWVSVQRVEGSSVLVTEGFDPDTARKIEAKVLTVNPAKTVQVELRSLMSPLRVSAVLQDAMGRLVEQEIEEVIQERTNDDNAEPGSSLLPLAYR